MDIHKPKPWHGLREFLKEYVIIVVGVLTALGAEQAVEWMHWRHQVAEAREELRSELGYDMEFLHRRAAVGACVDRRLDELARIMRQASSSGRLPPVGYFSGAAATYWRTEVWETQQASQALAHLRPKEINELGTVYRYVRLMEGAGAQERDAWLVLAGMTGPGRRLDPGSEAAIYQALNTARFLNRVWTNGVTEQNITAALERGGLGRNFPRLDWQGPRNTNVCNPISTTIPEIYGRPPEAAPKAP
jgi:hypothetical protein